jgi:transketolase
MRTAFINWLCRQAAVDPSIVLLTADLGYSVVEPYAQAFPARFINVGVAEQNMVGIAAGLASEGYKPYTYSIGIFPTFRCAEQIRNDVDYHNLSVVTTTVGSGVTYGALGYTHHMIQDLALMRSLPNTLIGTPADPFEVTSILEWHSKNPCPLYLRMHKAGDPQVHESLPDVKPGAWINISSRVNSSFCCTNLAVVVAGSLGFKALKALSEYNIQIHTYSLPLWGQSVRKSQQKWLSAYSHIITLEDHLLDGGFGSWMMETVNMLGLRTKIHPVALDSSSVGKVAREETLIQPLMLNFIATVHSVLGNNFSLGC